MTKSTKWAAIIAGILFVLAVGTGILSAFSGGGDPPKKQQSTTNSPF